MVDLAKRDGLELDREALEHELGVPIIETVAVRRRGIDELHEAIGEMLAAPQCGIHKHVRSDIVHLQRRAREIATAAVVSETPVRRSTHRLDAVLLHPVARADHLAVIMFVMFQGVFAWSKVPVDWIALGRRLVIGCRNRALPPGLLRIHADRWRHRRRRRGHRLPAADPDPVLLHPAARRTGYMVRAAFLMDRLMHGVGLSGHAFIPLLSSFACAVPGIMATRTIEDPKERLTTILSRR